MTSTGRSKGRPPKGAPEVGRDYILDRALEFIRLSGPGGFSRKTLAQFSGVTPALITYYFGSQDKLVYEVTAPVVQSYRRELGLFTRPKSGLLETLAGVMRLSMRLYGQDGRVLAAYEDVMSRGAYPLVENHATLISEDICALLTVLIGHGVCGDRNVSVLQSAIRGMCESVARTGGSLGDPAIEDDIADSLLHLVTHGLSYWMPDAFAGGFPKGDTRLGQRAPV